MTDGVVLDTNVLGRIAHPRANPDIMNWINGLLQAGIRVILPGIADYEQRREFLLNLPQMQKSLNRLNELRHVLEWMPLDNDTMELAAQLWADSRKRGKPTCDPKELDGDAILAAHAQRAAAIVATENVGHLEQWVVARPWTKITVDPVTNQLIWN